LRTREKKGEESVMVHLVNNGLGWAGLSLVKPISCNRPLVIMGLGYVYITADSLMVGFMESN
jgi:hypothetical protein